MGSFCFFFFSIEDAIQKEMALTVRTACCYPMLDQSQDACRETGSTEENHSSCLILPPSPPSKAIARPPAGWRKLWEAVWGWARACKPSRIQRNQARWSQDHWEEMGRGSSSATPCLLKFDTRALLHQCRQASERMCLPPCAKSRTLTYLPTLRKVGFRFAPRPWWRGRTVCPGLVALSLLLMEKALRSKDVGCTWCGCSPQSWKQWTPSSRMT